MRYRQTLPKLAKFNRSGSTSVAQKFQRKFHFTRERIDALPAPTNGQRSYSYDAKIRGLAVAVTGLGKKTFILYRKVSGRPERITIGPYGDLSIEQARKRAEEMNAAIALGGNPGTERRTVRDEMTLQELFGMFLELYAKVHKKRWKDDIDIFNLYLSGWKLRKISSIRKMDVVALHTRIGRKHPYAANRAIELLCSMFNRARTEWEWTGVNPAAGIKGFPEKKRDRFLQASELPAFFQALAEEPNELIRDFILLCLLTGARRRNVQSMEWSEIDFSRNLWTIPESKSKNGKPLSVVLTVPAMKLLKARREKTASQWVFPGVGRTGHLAEPKSCWKRILKRAGIANLRVHDLRRTLGSWQAAMGSSLPVIGGSLGHSSLEATQIYSRLSLDPIRESVSRATDAMFLAGGIAGLLKEGGQ
jgi:integrase